jgi:DNA repair exonuclease SbcCD ATPase subunit
MRDGAVALRLLIVLSVAGFIGLATALYEIDRREKSTSATVERNLAEIEQRVQILSSQIHILNDQLTAQLIAIELQLKATDGQVQNLRQQYESRLKELEDALRVRGLGSGPPR